MQKSIILKCFFFKWFAYDALWTSVLQVSHLQLFFFCLSFYLYQKLEMIHLRSQFSVFHLMKFKLQFKTYHDILFSYF